jgi:hypothetical protein
LGAPNQRILSFGLWLGPFGFLLNEYESNQLRAQGKIEIEANRRRIESNPVAKAKHDAELKRMMEACERRTTDD